MPNRFTVITFPRECIDCHEKKERIEFPTRMGPRCRKCLSKLQMKSPKRSRYKRSDKLKYRYGITIQQYEAMFNEQNGVCAVCKEPPNKRRLAVDHNHVTGTIRRLLCFRCNTIIGRVHENPEILYQLANYLEKYV
jgi:hypothetical protein